MSATQTDRRLCGLCHSSVGEEAVIAMNRLWHPEHFVCSGCRRPIKQTYQIADDKSYCVKCFASKHNPRCSGCHETLLETCLQALDKHWHPQCFCCAMCKRPLPNGEYFLVDDKPYDLDCHWAKRLEKRTRATREQHSKHQQDLV
uniref:LIM zinc-binding domain-containing protein n=1 Tax=Steinernema glaseri TaxID=37863 RepID=A0A1I7Z739_9BILA